MALVMPREGHGSRNIVLLSLFFAEKVMPREGHGSRNLAQGIFRVSLFKSCPARGMGVEILKLDEKEMIRSGHAPRGAWE